MATWAKVRLSNGLNNIVEQHAELNDISKPEAIKMLLRAYAREHYDTYPQDYEDE